MTQLWTMTLVWLALQLPLLIGKSIKLGMRDPVKETRRATQKRTLEVRATPLLR